MPHAKHFKLGLTSCWGCGINRGDGGDYLGEGTGGGGGGGGAETKKTLNESYDFNQHPEHAILRLATAAAAASKHHPTPGDVLIPWSHHATSESGGTSELCTLEPASGAGRATLFLRTTLAPGTLAKRLNRDFFKYSKMDVKTTGEDKDGKKGKNKPPSGASTSEQTRDGGTASAAMPARCASLVPEGGGSAVLVIESAPGSYMYGPVLALTCTTMEALEMLEHLDSIFPTGYACVVPHNAMGTVVQTVGGAMTMRLTRRTGVQRAGKKKTPPSSKTLATIFELESDGARKFDSPEGRAPHGLGDKVVARAVVAYRDASGWPSVGPTIQSIEVRRDYQGSELVQDLFNAIERWFVKSWTLDTVHWQRCLKATQLQNYVVDRKDVFPTLGVDDPSEESHVLTDKQFFYEVMHFVCNSPNPTVPLGQLSTDVAPETHAIKYYQPTDAMVPMPTVAYSFKTTAYGWRSCDNCRTLEENLGSALLVCGGCTLPTYWRAHYCSRQCQRDDWSIHKLCCGRSYEEVCAEKKALEKSILASVGAYP